MPHAGRSGPVRFRPARHGSIVATLESRCAARPEPVAGRRLGHPETQTRIAQYELAFRMQMAVPEVMDISRETAATLREYGAEPGASSLANNCLLARRLVEQGVRFVQLFDWGWDFHGTNPREDIRDGLTEKCRVMDRPVAALIRDLKARGLLDETLVIFSGEFGRTPFREGRTAKSQILGATIIRTATRSSWPVAACAPGYRTATRMNSAFASPTIRSMCMTCRRRSCTSWDLIMSD